MCVIAVCEDARLTDEQVGQMYDSNSHGGGVAWRERYTREQIAEDKNWRLRRALRDADVNLDDIEADEIPFVHWSKGHSKKSMIELNQTLPLPYVMHFRVPSHGTSKSILACHPFAINEEASCGFEGVIYGHVLFHNGLWTNWKDKMQNIAMSGHVWIPPGPWSDSRGLAWSAYHLGIGFLEMADTKIVAFGPQDEDIEVFGEWDAIKNQGAEDKSKLFDILVSNKGWERTTTTHHHGHNHGYPHNNREEKPGPLVKVTDHRNQNLVAMAAGPNAPAAKAEKGTGSSDDSQPGGAAGTATLFPGRATALESSGGNRSHNSQSVQEADVRSQQENNREHDAGVAGPGGSLTRCATCSKPTSAGDLLDDEFYCWQCWSNKNRQEGRKLLIGKCVTCKVNSASSKRLDTDEWICAICWRTNGQPKSYYVTRPLETASLVSV